MQSQAEQLLEQLELFNEAYRAGSPLISDAEYDDLVAQLLELDPANEWLRNVEPEPVSGKKTLRLPEPMLSTQKAYDVETLRRWYDNAVSVCGKPLNIRVTPKLDGFAAMVWGGNNCLKMSTRGDGEIGQDITHFIDRSAPYGMGKGEIVVDKKYFEAHLSDEYENTRNVIAAAIRESEPEPKITKALEDSKIVFVPFQALEGYEYTNIEDLIANLDNLWDFSAHYGYQTDGLVLEFTDQEAKEKLGSTSHHHRWQVAYKRNTEFHRVTVTGIEWQTSRNGRITPVVLIEPTRIGGVTVSRVTGHHAENVWDNFIGGGAVVEVTRSGQVIPYISKVITGGKVEMPEVCPSCGNEVWFEHGNVHIECTNTSYCPAQQAGRIEHFFKTIGCDGFGPAVCDLLKDKSIPEIFDMLHADFISLGVSEGITRRLSHELDVRVAEPIEDWRLLAAFGLPGMGEANCRKLMQYFSLPELFTAKGGDISAIDGFGGVRSANLINGLSEIMDRFTDISEFFQVETSRKAAGKSDITVVFTGTMNYPRTAMEEDARSHGWNVGSSVSAKTTYLVCGSNVGASKTEAAKKKGVKVITEDEYWSLVGGV